MTANQFRLALNRLGLSQRKFARLIGLSMRTGQRYALDECAIPEPVAILLRLLLAGKITIDDIGAQCQLRKVAMRHGRDP